MCTWFEKHFSMNAKCKNVFLMLLSFVGLSVFLLTRPCINFQIDFLVKKSMGKEKNAKTSADGDRFL